MIDSIEEYEKISDSFAMYPKDMIAMPSKTQAIMYPSIKLAGEVGEYMEKLGKRIRDNGGLIDEETATVMAKELGDIVWYVTQIALGLGFSMSQVLTMNIDKLSSRKERGVIQGSGDER